MTDSEKDAVRDALVRLRYSVQEIADRTGWTREYTAFALRGDIEGCDVFWTSVQRLTRNLANIR